MKIVRRILFGIICIIDLYCIYATIGYLILGLQTPKILGNKVTTFTGMYIMSLTFFCITLALSIIIIISIVKYKKNK